MIFFGFFRSYILNFIVKHNYKYFRGKNNFFVKKYVKGEEDSEHDGLVDGRWEEGGLVVENVKSRAGQGRQEEVGPGRLAL